jgi:hypothetical protein
MDVQKLDRSSETPGLSLVGLLMVVVVLGTLAATATVGVSTLTDNSNGSGRNGRGSPPTDAVAAGGAASRATTARAAPGATSASARSSCSAAADAARSGSTLYFADSGGTSYPVKWSDLTASNPPVYMPATSVVVNRGNPKELDGRGWKLIVSGGGASAPTFTCS